ncbi:MAG TPA: flavin reductase [Streptosporangiaceae bacterium]|jgi:flavin reductase (DIM6/NTAB) family NADH-FMN oxidoreductase RutF|nr:flavin reductase [Streptosporangiaceae bacterium]
MASGSERFAASGLVASETFRAVAGHFASGVTVVTTRTAATDYGTTASSVASLSLAPPMMLVCLNQESATGQAVLRSGVYAVNVLSQGQANLARTFAAKGGDKFGGVEYRPGQLGVPLLAGALAHIECRVTGQVSGGTHTVFLGEVRYAAAEAGHPLAYYRGDFGRFELGRDVVPVVQALDEALDARCAIEIGVVDLTISQVPAVKLAELRRRLDRMTPYITGNHFVDVARYLEANDAFHECIVSLAENPSLLAVYQRLSVKALLARALRSAPDTSWRAIELQTAFTEAFASGQRERAKSALRDYTEFAKQYTRRALHSAA